MSFDKALHDPLRVCDILGTDQGYGICNAMPIHACECHAGFNKFIFDSSRRLKVKKGQEYWLKNALLSILSRNMAWTSGLSGRNRLAIYSTMCMAKGVGRWSPLEEAVKAIRMKQS